MSFPFRNIPPGAEFFDILSLVEKVQTKLNPHLLTVEDVKTSLHLFENMKQYAEKCYVEVYPAYSFKGYEYKRTCTCLVVTDNGGSVRRIFAPEAYLGQGSRYVIHLINAHYPILVPRGYFVVKGTRENLSHVILKQTS